MIANIVRDDVGQHQAESGKQQIFLDATTACVRGAPALLTWKAPGCDSRFLSRMTTVSTAKGTPGDERWFPLTYTIRAA
jgi:hypothetical protein